LCSTSLSFIICFSLAPLVANFGNRCITSCTR
jgi:hypothetical protein